VRHPRIRALRCQTARALRQAGAYAQPQLARGGMRLVWRIRTGCSRWPSSAEKQSRLRRLVGKTSSSTAYSSALSVTAVEPDPWSWPPSCDPVGMTNRRSRTPARGPSIRHDDVRRRRPDPSTRRGDRHQNRWAQEAPRAHHDVAEWRSRCLATAGAVPPARPRWRAGRCGTAPPPPPSRRRRPTRPAR
jgi:hypothetical protein